MEHLVLNDSDLVCLYRFKGNFDLAANASAADRLQNAALAVMVDTETTGTSVSDVVIEIALQPFWFDSHTGVLLEISDPYEGLQDPGRPIPPEASAVNGITDTDVKGKMINWKMVNSMLENAHFVIAYNASFDRPMVHKGLQAAGLRPAKAAWVCAMTDIEWSKQPQKPPSNALSCVCAWHGFFFKAHRALDDCKATIHLLDVSKQLLTLAERAKRSSVIVGAKDSPFHTKDLLKERHYSWDPTKKYWWKEIPDDPETCSAEMQWLSEHVYCRAPNTALQLAVPRTERFL